ncbi:hypothetical protein Aperf_G00000108713 [Anoplocephala perfoliata]
MPKASPLLEQVKSSYSRLLSGGDPRVSDWAMMASPMPTFAIIGVYLFVVWYGFEIRNIVVFLNVCMVALSLWMVYEFCAVGWIFGGYSLGCQPVDRSMHPQALRMARVCWVYYISKLIELADTVFFILRRKFQLITFLHVFHHAAMASSWWFFVEFVPGGFSIFHALLNSFIHVWMYTYYALAAAGPHFHPYLWWKREDHRVSDWAMMASSMPKFGSISAYLSIVWHGQKVMAQRNSGFEIRNITVFYNACMVALSVWLVYEFSAAGWIFLFCTLGCQPVDRSMHPQPLRMPSACWVYYISQPTKSPDTIFFILRRKFEHFSSCLPPCSAGLGVVVLFQIHV